MLSSSVRLVGGRELLRNAISRTSRKPNSDPITSRQQVRNVQVFVGEQRRTSKWAHHSKRNDCRAVSTVQTNVTPLVGMVSKEEHHDFMAVFPDIVRDLTDEHSEVAEWYGKVLHYNVPNGKKTRSLALVSAYKMFEDPDKLTPENLRLAYIMGWCVELFQAFFLMLDDIIDHAETRRGIPCWYKTRDVGLAATNDAILLEQGIYATLKRHFSARPYYIPAVELFHDISKKTAMGQVLDMSNGDGKPDFSLFTMKRYNTIVKYKTVYYSCQFPVALATYMTGKSDPEICRQVKAIMMEMGILWQVQDDFLCCFGENIIADKTSCDIREGKCTWLIVMALQRATAEQREVLEANYGRSESKAVQVVRDLYEKLGLPNAYSVYKEETYNLIRTRIQQISKSLPDLFFLMFLDVIYKG